MIRIAEKEISVNIQMKIQREDGSFQSELYVFDPGWGDRHADPVILFPFPLPSVIG